MSRLTIVLALILAGPAAAASLTPDQQIAKELDGRVAGKPTNCIYQYDIRDSRIIERTAIIYEMRDGTLYLNRPANGADFLRRDLALVTDTHTDQLCSVDIVRLYDPVTRFESGSLGLGPFVPYRRSGRK